MWNSAPLRALIVAGIAVGAGAMAQADIRRGGTEGIMRAAPTAGVVPVTRIAIYDETRTGLGQRLARFIGERLKGRGIRVDDAAALILTIRPAIVTPNGGPSPTDDPLSISPSAQARISAAPVWNKDKSLGVNRLTAPSDQLDGGRVSLHIRNKLRRLPPGSALYRIQLQIERDGQAPLWYGVAVAAGRSSNAERALAHMADLLLVHLGRRASTRKFRTR